MRIIAFGHQKDVGKDTATRFFVSYLRTTFKGINVKVCGFADKVKSIAYDLFSWAGLQTKEFYDDPSNYHLKEAPLIKIGKSPRQVWIDIGNGLRDKVYEPVWAAYLFNEVRQRHCDVLVVNDFRFPNEGDYLLENGNPTFLVKLSRPRREVQRDGADDRLLEYQKWTHFLNNDGSLNDLNAKILSLAKELMRVTV